MKICVYIYISESGWNTFELNSINRSLDSLDDFGSPLLTDSSQSWWWRQENLHLRVDFCFSRKFNLPWRVAPGPGRGARGSGRQTCLQKLVPPADRNCRSWFKANNEAWTANKLNCRRLCGIFSAFVGLSSTVHRERERDGGVRGQSWTNLNHGILV